MLFDGFVKKCQLHGLLNRREVIKSGFTLKGTQEYKCVYCNRPMKKDNWRKNKRVREKSENDRNGQ